MLMVSVCSIDYYYEFFMYQHMQDPIMMTVIAMANSIPPDALIHTQCNWNQVQWCIGSVSQYIQLSYSTVESILNCILYAIHQSMR